MTVLGHVQRGGTPSGRDRVTATRMGYRAVELLAQAALNRVVCFNNGQINDFDIDEALSMHKGIDLASLEVLEAMTGV